MGLLSRLKRLWELSATEGKFLTEVPPLMWQPYTGEVNIPEAAMEPGEVVFIPAKRMATVIDMGDPLEVFEDDGTNEQPTDGKDD